MKMPQVTLKKQNEIVIAATSDLHGYLEGIRQVCNDNNVDILIIAGDIQPADIQYHCNDTACGHWFRNKFFNLIKKLKCEVVAIPGNHDFWLRSFIQGDFGTPEERKEKFFIPDNFHLLAESEVTIKGLRIYGTPWVPWISGHWCFEAEEKELVWKWKQIPEGIDILVTHTPPRYENHNIDVSLERDPNAHRHFGSYSLADRIREVNPSLVFCGHIHSGDHKCHVEYKKNAPHGNFVWNVSRVNERYFIGYPIRVVRLGEKTVSEREKDSLAIEQRSNP